MSRSLVVFYGTNHITGAPILDQIAQQIDQHQNLLVTNASMGGDPNVGTEKYAMVYYRLDNQASQFLRGRIAAENQFLPFDTDIVKIEYGPLPGGGNNYKVITEPGVYYTLYHALISQTSLKVDNTLMGGDVNVGTVKNARISFYNHGAAVVTRSTQEGSLITWD